MAHLEQRQGEASVRVGLLGCGRIAHGAHAPALRALRARARLVAVCDTDVGRAQKLARAFDADVEAHFEALVSRRDIDMVLVATPEYAHREQVEAAASCGKHVLCEKPIALTVDDANAMLRACERAGVLLMVGHSRRFTQRYLEARQAIDAGELGSVRLIRENERRPRVPDQPGQYYQPGHWTADPTRSRGIALTAAIHETDLFRWYAGSEPVSIYAEHDRTLEGNDAVPDFLSFTVRFANGCLASSELSRILPVSYPGFHQFEIYGSHGAYRARDSELASLVHYRNEGAMHPGLYGTLLYRDAIYVRQLASFLDALDARTSLPLDPGDAVRALELALAADESARTGRVVTLPRAGASHDGAGRQSV